MIILLLSILFYLAFRKTNWILWLVLPISFFADLWKMNKLGITGIKILAIIFLLEMVFGKRPENHKLKI